MAGVPLGPEARAALARAADGFLPLSAWIERKGFVPDAAVPWRNGGRLDATTMAVADFLEALLRESSGDADLKSRWDAFAAAPMMRCPIIDVSIDVEGCPPIGVQH